MPSLGTAYVVVKADSKSLQPGLKKAEKAVESSVVRMSDKLKNVGFQAAAVAAAAFGAAVIYNMKKAVDAASDLEEVTSKFGVVFKDQIQLAEKNAKILVDSYAMSTREAKQYLSSVQDLLVPMGMASGQAAMLSNEIVKLSADLGSFNNLPTERVMSDIQSALVGNFETMKKYGVVLNAATVAQEAMNLGLITSKDQLTANIKAQAAYSLMVKGSQAAIGDMERTSGSYANQMKQVRSNVENLRAEFGKHLLPVLTKVTQELNNTMKSINPDDIKFAAESVAILADSFIGLGKAIMAIPSFLIKVGGMMETEVTVVDDLVKKIKEIPSGQVGYPDMSSLLGGSGPPLPPPGDNSPADMGRLAALAEIQEKEMAMWIEQNNAKIELEKDLQAENFQQARDAAEAQLNMYIEYSNREIAAEKAKLKLKKSLEKGAIKNAQYTFATLMNLSQGHNKAMFELAKTAGIATAIVSTYTGAANALKDVPYPYNFIAAAAVIASGMAQVAQIRSQSFDSGGGVAGGAIATPGTGLPISPPEAGVTEYDTTPKEDEKKGKLIINIEGDFIGDEAYIDMLVEKINAADDRDVFINKSLTARELE